MKSGQILESKIQEARLKYPALKNKSYLNFGAQGSMALSTIERIQKSYEYVQENGPLSAAMFGWIVEECKKIKAILAEELGAQVASLALTQNATEGCNIALWGYEWQENDCLLTTDSEHNGVMKAALQLCKRRKLRLEICRLADLQSEEEIISELEKSIRQNKPKLFMLSHVLWNTGKVLPLKEITEICHKHDVLVLADGAQSVGVLPLNLKELGADFYAFTGHKWLGGPEGIGALYIKPESLERIEPTFAGWRGAVFDAKGYPVDWAPDASRFEVATAPFPLLSGLAEAIKLHREFGTAEERYQTILKNTARLSEALKSIPGLSLLNPGGGSSLLSFKIDKASHLEIVKKLDSQKIILRTIPNPDCIRASLHYFSNGEIDALVDGLKKLV
ncbi:MAG: aminotransferase class V-fold PLP-dependent enzyme [Candidatus Obscuribacterales bacterium]|nr:aminotransferase class V-fold PLP-dependent enzyme [Candidatus Obscuribacterales bacterium]